jgi:hypothetical protein
VALFVCGEEMNGRRDQDDSEAGYITCRESENTMLGAANGDVDASMSDTSRFHLTGLRNMIFKIRLDILAVGLHIVTAS